MAEFSEVQQALRDIQHQIASEQKQIFHNQERLKKLDLVKSRVVRVKTSDSREYSQVTASEQKIRTEISQQQRRLGGLLQEKASWIKEFQAFTDPRENVGFLDDHTPIMLFPVRLETRFKIITTATAGTVHQLWVRIFPDECSIDTFDDTLSESEIEKAKAYWTTIWQAGQPVNEDIKSFVKDKHRGAWRKLMGIFNAGRSFWITENFRPLNEDEIPERQSESDIILIIPTYDLPVEQHKNALSKYWSSYYLAADDEEGISDAFNQLVIDVGNDETLASSLIERYKPGNIDETSPDDEPEITVSFLQFKSPEQTDSKLSAWSQAAEVKTFPERFVLLGYQNDHTNPTINIIGNTIPDPLIVGPDTRDDIEALLKDVYGEEAFDELSEEEKSIKYIEYLSQHSETSWLFDFDEAVSKGLGFKVTLTEGQYRQGFSRLFVLGIKLGADSLAAQHLLEDLFKNHQFGDRTFSILPQGTPTNNTEEEGSGYSINEDPEEAFERYFGEETPEDPYERLIRKDGRWLANMLGIDIQNARLHLAQNYYHTDQSEASAMHTALWNATIGYFMESMLTPVASEWEIDQLRWFLIHYVSGRGRMPAIRIANQPYGILPVTTFRDFKFMNQRTEMGSAYSDDFPTLKKIYNVLKIVKDDWRTFLDEVAHVGKQGGDVHQILLDALGLHASSVEYDRRVAESLISNANAIIMMQQQGKVDYAALEEVYTSLGLNLLNHLGYVHDIKENPRIPILEKSFLGQQQDVNKFVVDDNPLSESDPIRPYTEDDKNYIEWLIDKARNKHSDIRNQVGFKDNKRPVALLYDMLRHAMNLEFGNTALKLYRQAELINPVEASLMRMDADFIEVQQENTIVESKWDIIYRKEPQINNDLLVVDHISNLIKNAPADPTVEYLQEVLDALERLKDVPTARLERCFAEHLDCCYYRLDSWLMGFLHLQLEYMRFGGEQNESDISNGIYLGAYGFVENLKPENKLLTPANIDEELLPIFDPEGKNDVMVDSKNAGYVHAPSINHGLTAAVLRNAYISTASPSDAETYKVNLSSERVRLAMSIIEGMQKGQRLGALLGYHLERGLHDNNQEEMDIFIYELRKVFPLGSNRLRSTEIKVGKVSPDPKIKQRYIEEEEEFEEDKAVSKIEANNVVDGLALLEHIRKENKPGYPFGFAIGTGADKLKAASANEKEAIDAEVERIMNIRDAVADLAIAESVHQVVQGNYDRAAGALDAYSKGHYPQLPDVIQSNGSGVSLTNRFGIHLPEVTGPVGSTTPRGITAPRINAWLNDLFPLPNQVTCLVNYTIPNYDNGPENAPVSQYISMDDMGIKPIDLLYLDHIDNDKTLSSLDDHVMKALFDGPSAPTRLDAIIEINYTNAVANTFSFFEIGAMIENLKKLIISSKPLSASDITLQNEAEASQISSSTIDPGRITSARDVLFTSMNDLKTKVVDELDGLVNDEDLQFGIGNSDLILNKIDSLSMDFADIMGGISLFGKPQSGSGYVFDRLASIYAGLYKKMLDYKLIWDEKEALYDDLITVQLPAATTPEDEILILQNAESAISAVYDVTFTNPADLLSKVAAKKVLFDNKLGDMTTYLATNRTTLSSLFAATEIVLSNIDLFDLDAPTVVDNLKQVVILAEDLYKQGQKLYMQLDKTIGDVDSLVSNAGTSADPAEKIEFLTKAAKLLFGEQFQVLPEFTFTADQASEIQNCINDQSQLLDYQVNTEKTDFPVDDWLYGIARVREKLGHWENFIQLYEGFKSSALPLELLPIQLPYQENDSWLALSYPETYQIESDKLLYTTYHPSFDPTKAQCGLLVDEWTEVIPAEKENTGMTFHYDRPNCEPPQSMLLVTPSEFTGRWKWEDIVNSLHDTLEMMQYRAIEPDHIDQTNYAKFLPATVATVTTYPVTMALNYVATAFVTND